MLPVTSSRLLTALPLVQGGVAGGRIAHVTVFPEEPVVGAVRKVGAAGNVAGSADPVRRAVGAVECAQVGHLRAVLSLLCGVAAGPVTDLGASG